MKTILDVLNLTTTFLQQKGFVQPRRQAQDLLSRALMLKPMDLYLHFDKPLCEEELIKCREWLARRAKHEPAAYIDGHVQFFDADFIINSHVLIPRPETEILADHIARYISAHQGEQKILWDICTGSGCLGISLKKRFPKLQVSLSDISLDALAVARQNAEKNDVDVKLLHGDLFAPFKGQRADFIVCNPPYISESDFEHLERDVREYEPKLALVGGETGLEFYHRLAADLPQFIARPAAAWLEMGNSQGEGVKNLFKDPCWKLAQVEKDWAGWDRFFFLEIE